VRLAALNLEGDLRGGYRVPGSETVISGIIRFSLKFTCSHFLLKCHFLCKLRRIYVYAAHWNS